jgi:5-methyltetrahydrofolate--homocysteine methyltransferase
MLKNYNKIGNWGDLMNEEILKEIQDALIIGDDETVVNLTKKVTKKGIDPKRILSESFIPGMVIVGDKFSAGDYFIPEMLIAARAMQMAMQILEPLLIGKKISYVGKAIMGTVQGDMHDIGKNLVCIMLKGNGFDVIDLGVDVPTEKFIEEAVNSKVDIVGLSALLTTTRPMMKTIIGAFKEVGLRHKVKIMVGGAPVTQEYADKIGADGYAPDAGSAAAKALELIRKSTK